MPIVTMPDGANVSFPDGMPRDQIRSMILQKFPDAEKAAAAPATPATPATPAAPQPDKPRSWSDVPGEALSNIPSDAYDVGAGLVKGAASVAEKVAPYARYGPIGAPTMMAADAAKAIYNDPAMLKRIPAAAWKTLVDEYGSEDAIKRTIATHPVKFALDVATVLGGGEAAISRVARGVGEVGEMARAADVSKPFYDMPRGPEPPPGGTPPPLPAQPPPVPMEPGQAAVREAVASQPRALTTDNRFLQSAGQNLSKLPLVGEPLGRAIEAVPEKFGEARNVVADQLGGYRTTQNVAGDIGEHLRGQAEAEAQAGRQAATQADEIAQAEHERALAAREAATTASEDRSTQAARGQLGNVAPDAMGDTIIDTVRENHARLTDAKDRAYEAAGNAPGEISAEGVRPLFRQAESAFAQSGRHLSNETPAANNVRTMIQQLSDLEIPADMRGPHVPGEASDAISVQGLNLFRKRIGSAVRTAKNPEDAAAARVYANAFDEWQNGAMQTHLASGDPATALRLHQQANAANRDLMQRFGYNGRNDADTLLNKIVQPGDQTGSEDVSKALLAGDGKSRRLLNAVYQATADHPTRANEVAQAVRGGFWNKVAGGVVDGKRRTPEAIASNINEFMAKPIARDIYGPQDQQIARAHAQTLRQAVQARQDTEAFARTERPVPSEVVKGPAQELADRVLGRGEKPAEALYATVEGLAKAKGGGKDIATLGRLWASLPQELRGNFRNTFIRGLGTGTDGTFSAKKFVNDWRNNINPQAKSIILGDGAHVRALDELADASEKFDEVHRRFGNVSGSGQAVNFMKIAGKAASLAGGLVVGSVIGPVGAAGSWFGARQFAHLLATPQGAMSASRYVRAAQRLREAPSAATAAAAKLSVRNMANTAAALGIAHNIPSEK